MARLAGLEPATYGLEGKALEFPKLLKLQQIFEMIIFLLANLFRFLLILARFGKFFSHGFSHGILDSDPFSDDLHHIFTHQIKRHECHQIFMGTIYWGSLASSASFSSLQALLFSSFLCL